MLPEPLRGLLRWLAARSRDATCCAGSFRLHGHKTSPPGIGQVLGGEIHLPAIFFGLTHGHVATPLSSCLLFSACCCTDLDVASFSRGVVLRMTVDIRSLQTSGYEF